MAKTFEESVKQIRESKNFTDLVAAFYEFFGLKNARRIAVNGLEWRNLDKVAEIIRKFNNETNAIEKGRLWIDYYNSDAWLFDTNLKKNISTVEKEVEKAVEQEYRNMKEQLIEENKDFIEKMDENLKKASIISKVFFDFRKKYTDSMNNEYPLSFYEMGKELSKGSREEKEANDAYNRYCIVYSDYKKAKSRKKNQKNDLGRIGHELAEAKKKYNIAHEKADVIGILKTFEYLKSHDYDTSTFRYSWGSADFIEDVKKTGIDNLINDAKRYLDTLSDIDNIGENLIETIKGRLLENSQVTEEDAEMWFDECISLPIQDERNLKDSGRYNSFKEDCKEFFRLTGGRLGYLSFQIGEKDRASFSGVLGKIHLDDDFTKKTLFHELSHAVDFLSSTASNVCYQFVYDRATKKKPVKLKTLTGIDYRRNEVAFPDTFVDPYVGKDCRGKLSRNARFGSEVFSMGMQALADPQEIIKLISYDREHFLLTLGLAKAKKEEEDDGEEE